MPALPFAEKIKSLTGISGQALFCEADQSDQTDQTDQTDLTDRAGGKIRGQLGAPGGNYRVAATRSPIWLVL